MPATSTDTEASRRRRAARELAEAVDRAPDDDDLRTALVQIQCERASAGELPRGEIEEALALALLLESGPGELPAGTIGTLAMALHDASGD